MPTTTARVETAHAQRYLGQLCKHWSHRFEVSCDAANGEIRMSGAVLVMEAQEGFLELTLNVEDIGEQARMQTVVAEHLDRFAFREGPLAYGWR